GASNDAGQTITLSGDGVNTTATTDANGNFSIEVAVTQMGTLSATYAAGMQKASARGGGNPPAPDNTNFTARQEPRGYWGIKGTDTGAPDPAGMVIHFGGLQALQNQTAGVAADGTFDEVFQLNGQTGCVTAMTTDWWGQVGGAATSVS